MIDYYRKARYPALWQDCLVAYSADVQRASKAGEFAFNLANNRWHAELSAIISYPAVKIYESTKGPFRAWYGESTNNGYAYTILGRFPDLLEDFTIALWMVIESEVTGSPIFTRNSPQPWFFASVGQVLQLAEYGAAVRCQGVATLSLNTLYHVAVTKRGTSFAIYINGQVDATNTSAISGTASSTDGDTFLFDGGNLGFNRCLQGYREDMRIYSRALSQAEIQLLASRPGIAYELQPEPWYIEAAQAAIMPQIIWW